MFGYDLIMGAASAAVALVVSYYVFRAYATTRERYFLLLQLGFAFAGVGLLMDSLLAYVSIASGNPLAFKLGYTLYFFSTLIAYALILGSYAVGQLRKPVLYMAAAVSYGALPETILMTPLTVVVVQSGLNLAARKSLNTFLVFLAFTLILVSHLTFAVYAIIPAHIFRFSGFMVFALFIARVVKKA